MPIRRSNLDGVALVFFLAGAFIVVSEPANATIGWILIIIGIIKQFAEWK